MEFAIILPLLLTMLLGVIDFGVFYSETIGLQAAAREGARQGITQGDVVASVTSAKGNLDAAKLQTKFIVDTSGGAPGKLVVCLRYPERSVSGFFSWMLDGYSETKYVMKMESTAAITSGANNWTGGTCAA
ncbi:TadE/TadG family type IV pilus assembly protein [Paenarthrobacter sp. GOM3]|uniref:TadE/TadG family type IV pilus assembly protein n=1 Tax=Paenarthrobacter sp. GOM3 TaxID=2782567 RepID=UPI001BA800DD|nr:TadE/TadG family type IV pilus assembly protein [Paenarthrobacter sp. GOM3]WOH17567.1 TadE/TadG family type IV pilus assembly protein [Paenarthrobacter sp. GOM3]